MRYAGCVRTKHPQKGGDVCDDEANLICCSVRFLWFFSLGLAGAISSWATSCWTPTCCWLTATAYS
jgi:hypothetical protein